MASLPLDRVYHLKMILILLPWNGYIKIENQIQNLSKINTRLHSPSSSIFNSLHLPYSIILFRQSFYTSLILTHIFEMILINANSLQNNDEKIQTNPNSSPLRSREHIFSHTNPNPTLQSPKVARTYLFPYKMLQGFVAVKHLTYCYYIFLPVCFYLNKLINI